MDTLIVTTVKDWYCAVGHNWTLYVGQAQEDCDSEFTDLVMPDFLSFIPYGKSHR